MRRAIHLIAIIFILTLIAGGAAAGHGPVYAQIAEGEAYVVQQGDTLEAIADRFSGEARAIHTIVDATNARAAEDSSFIAITDPNSIRTGQKLWIPADPALLSPSVRGQGPLISGAQAAPRFGPRWQQVECATFDIRPGVIDAACGYVTVPQFHAIPERGSIQLAIVIAKSINHPALEDVVDSFDRTPLFMARGGPGKSAFDLLPFVILPASGLRPILWTRDVVFVEQRGTRYSIPYLACSENLDPDRIGLEWDTACKDQLANQGIDFNAYDSLENAADMIMVADTLGYERFNVYGESYGSLLAQFMMSQYPDRIRAVILDAVVPLDINFNANAAQSGSQALRALFTACAEDAACNGRYPDLEQVFSDVVDDLSRAPVVLTPRRDTDGRVPREIVVGGDVFAGHMFDLMYNKRILRHLPRLIYEAAAGNYDWLRPSPPTENPEPTVARAMAAAINCSHNEYPEQGAFFAPAYPELKAVAYNMAPLCTLYDVDPLPDETYDPLMSEIPTLILNGQFDPITPPQYGEYVGDRLANSFVYTYPGEGHGVMLKNPCVGFMAASFLIDPAQSPGDSCMKTLRADFAIVS